MHLDPCVRSPSARPDPDATPPATMLLAPMLVASLALTPSTTRMPLRTLATTARSSPVVLKYTGPAKEGDGFMSDELMDGFGGCLTAGAVAEGRPRGQVLSLKAAQEASCCHRPRWFRATEIETGFIENRNPMTQMALVPRRGLFFCGPATFSLSSPQSTTGPWNKAR